MIYIDQLNRKIQLEETPNRIISLVPSQTELLVDLGLIDSIVGITKFCIHPKELLKQKTVVGGTKNINLQKIKKLNPDIILCNKEENSKEIIDALKEIAPIHVSDIYDIDDVYQLINSYGKLFQVDKKAALLVKSIKDEREQFQIETKESSKKKAAYFIWKKPWMVAGLNTYIDYMLGEAGFENVFKAQTRYPEVKLDNLRLKEVEIIILSSEPFPFKDVHIKEMNILFPNKKIIVVDGEMFSWYGSRLKYAYNYFRTLSH
ncbi:cobalamin-binding protein [Winogradskyella sp. PC-19]|uniref:ABC transporter substrate-binding protein n=1 Tax=unclassified Winogradskyella TaxID=2615021 RepID=UPI000B3C18F4|nr:MULTISPECIES: helical backbone metal receptor [unclassified Winogradskyella]ARV09064.1 cobalamin-binding protein [Winogradskyella sp. PC-19]RZN76182.1 MAG: cobalamin-binding protein [Winogradskyella sp.]